MRVNDDMTLAEIADACQMTRQGAYDAFAQARKQLKAYEEALGLAGRYRQIQRQRWRNAGQRWISVEAAPGAAGGSGSSQARAGANGKDGEVRPDGV